MLRACSILIAVFALFAESKVVLSSKEYFIHKCCESNQQFNESVSCVAKSKDYSITTYNRSVPSLNKVPLKYAELDCDKYMLEPSQYEGDVYFLQDNGTLWMPNADDLVNFEEYCVDRDSNGTDHVLVCYRNETESDISIIAYKIGMIISMPFLILTFIVYLLLPERNLHAKCLMCYVLSLALAYFFLVFIQFNNSLSPATCAAFAAFCHYFFMSSFCWMNISCVDIFWTFSGKRGFGLSNKSAERKRFLIYCLYTYLFPLCLIGIIFILNQGEKKTWFHPQFGHGQCFLGKGYPHLLYFYGPMGIMLIFNVILFTLTALKIRQINRDTAMLKRPENKMHYDRDRQTFQLYMKLLLALGINWTMEFISWLVNWTLNDTYKEIWYVTDFCNAIYGVIIFIIFVCKKSIWIMLKKRYYIFKGQPQKARSLSMRTSAFEMSQTEKTVVY
ncbi:PREDICTED: G-protein coupled receptor Mth2-like isoform X2 [Nicrophorus vespilloides]|uniref:G-protein coupled receptor Mth2-like isoform X2 n=1 Tax=Nicrophorus vespilloides TaxID=110193 RepID=A0ABM1M7Y3_NICVS|nr:PREDICTED: G-protein coupled receptor Mth2-like isoform X2 [Nicrophorus vespilloides]